MTGLTAALVLAGVVALVGIIGLWVAARAYASLADRYGSTRLRVQELEAAVGERDRAMLAMTSDRDNEAAARRRAEEAVRYASQQIATCKDPRVLVDALNDELRALETMSQADAAASARGAAAKAGDRNGTVYGAIPAVGTIAKDTVTGRGRGGGSGTA